MLNAIEGNNLGAAKAGDHAAFARLVEPYRQELLVHCYRMLGSLQDAEDLLQETLLRAWRKLDTFEYHASIRAWLYKIATHACLDTLDARPKRTLPSLAYPASNPRVMFAPPVIEPIWIEPLPDELLADASTGPEARHLAHEDITLAFLIALQFLPASQRAVLIMREVLDFSAAEVAEMLALTVSAVNSVLHRARVTLAKHYHTDEQTLATKSVTDETLREQLNRYVDAWDMADVDMLIELLKADARLEMPPSPSWYQGRDSIYAFMATFPFSGDGRGRWQVRQTRTNSQPAFELFRLDRVTNRYQSVGLQILTFDERQIAAITLFLKPEFFSGFQGHRT